MDPRREMNLKDYLAMFRRRRVLVVAPLIAGAILGYAVSLAVPRRYTSRAVILVGEPNMADTLVKTTVADQQSRLAGLRDQIFSSTSLQPLLEQFGPPNGSGALADRIEALRKSIRLTPLSPMPGTRVQDLQGFSISVTHKDPRQAQQLCAVITSKFVDSNARVRREQVQHATDFIATQLQDAKARLEEQDAKLRAFQSRYLGALPEDERTNATLMTGLTPQLQAATQALAQAHQDKLLVESLLNQQLSALRLAGDAPDALSIEQRLAALQAQLLALRGRFTEEHPDMVKLRSDIARLEQQRRALEGSATAPAKRDSKMPIEPSEVRQLRAQLRQVELTIQEKKTEQDQLQRQMRVLQSRIQLSPAVERELRALARDHKTALDFHSELLKKRDESQMASDLENRQQGERLTVLDPPDLPEKHSFPSRRLFAVGGLLGGLAFGLGLAYWAEMRARPMRTQHDVECYMGAVTLAVIPLVERAGHGRAVAGNRMAQFAQRIRSGVRQAALGAAKHV